MMAIFSNRSLDRMLRAIAPVINEGETKWLRRRLARGANHGAGAEWEIAIVYGLSRVGTIRAIPDRAGTRKLDVLFAPSEDPTAIVQIEVTAISDADRPDRLLQNKTLANRLQKKGRQSRGTGMDYPVVVVLADNDCFALRRGRHTQVPSAEDAVDEILAGRREWREGPWLLQAEVPPLAPAVSGVLLLSVRDSWTSGRGLGARMTPTYIPNRRLPVVSRSVIDGLERAFQALPPIRQSPMRARARQADHLPDHYGGGLVRVDKTRTQFHLSLLGVQQMLDGVCSTEQFVRDHEEMIKFMRLAVEHGRYLFGAHVETCLDEDDDWLVLEFRPSGSGPDASPPAEA